MNTEITKDRNQYITNERTNERTKQLNNYTTKK